MVPQIDHFSLCYSRTKDRNRPLYFKREAVFLKTEMKITPNLWVIRLISRPSFQLILYFVKFKNQRTRSRLVNLKCRFYFTFNLHFTLLLYIDDYIEYIGDPMLTEFNGFLSDY